jgi:hypothetical protein
VRENHAAVGDGVARRAAQLAHQIRVRQAVESEPADAVVEIPARNRQQLRHARQIAMKGGVQARDLRHAGERSAERADQRDFLREVRRIEIPVLFELGNQLRSHAAMLEKPDAAVNDAVADRGDALEGVLGFQPVDQPLVRARGVRRLDALFSRGRASAASTASTDSLEPIPSIRPRASAGTNRSRRRRT